MMLLAILHTALLCGALALLSLLWLGLRLQLARASSVRLKAARVGAARSAARLPPPYRRGLHHLLFFVVSALCWLAAGLGLWLGHRAGGLLLAGALLLLMPLTRPGQPAHWRLACLIGAAYPLAAWWAW